MSEAASHRLLISLTPTERDRLRVEADKLGLRFATYCRSLVVQHLQAKRARK